jgi:hypothetical protein
MRWRAISSGSMWPAAWRSRYYLPRRDRCLHAFTGTLKWSVLLSASQITIFLTSISVLHLALLKRAMRFSEVSVNDIFGRIVSVAVSILLGWSGWGYWALVGGVVAQTLSVTVGAWTLCRWMPGVPRRAEGTGSSLKYALHTYGHFGVTYFSRNTDNLLVGWRFDAQSLGYYKKAYDLFALTASQLVSSTTVVVVAALSRVQKDAAQFRRYLFGAIACNDIRRNVAIGGSHVGWKGSHSAIVGTALGAGGTDLYFFWAGNRRHDSLWHPQLDSPFHRQSRPLVPLGDYRVRRNFPVIYRWTAMGSGGNSGRLDGFLLDYDHPFDVVRRKADRVGG